MGVRLYVNRSRDATIRTAHSAQSRVPSRVRHLLGPSSQDHGLANSDRRCCRRCYQRTSAPLGIERTAYANDANGCFANGLVCSPDHRREFASDASWDDSPYDRHDGTSNASWVAIVSRRCSRTSNAGWVPCRTSNASLDFLQHPLAKLLPTQVGQQDVDVDVTMTVPMASLCAILTWFGSNEVIAARLQQEGTLPSSLAKALTQFGLQRRTPWLTEKGEHRR